MKLKILLIIARGLFVLCLPCLLLTASIWWAANNHGLYTSGFAKYDVATSTGLNEAELDKVATGLIDYFNSGEEFVDITVVKDGQSFELFTEEEILHFRDVKGLFRFDFYVLLGTGIYVGCYAAASLIWRRPSYWRGLSKSTLIGSGITLVLMLALGLGTFLDFDQLFLQFHLLSFSNEFWSAEGYMVLLFPRDFWYNTAIYCATVTTAAAVILGAVSAGHLLLTRRAISGQADYPVTTDNGERVDDG
jgi:integral membrane protein (TIGR01906 family)